MPNLVDFGRIATAVCGARQPSAEPMQQAASSAGGGRR